VCGRDNRIKDALEPGARSGRCVGEQGATLSITLFLFGNIIARDPSLAMGPHEPTTSLLYWLTTLDVFNAGDNLPCQTTGNDVSLDATSTDDWRVTIA
jgi:hypothetical protein